jgi:Outer membrane protein beta-barrel domain
MRNLLLVLMLLPLLALSQNNQSGKPAGKSSKSERRIGIIAGLNFANVSKVSSISSTNETGFMVGAFFATPSPKLLSFRMEFIYSKQGYDYKTNTNTGTVDKHYIMMPMIGGINIGRFTRLYAGFQTAILLNAKADSSTSQPGTDPNANPYASGDMMKMMNRLNYGLAGGLEIYPYKGIILGGRYNMSFGDIFKTPTPSTTPGAPAASFLSDIDAKNNVVQLYLGYRF